MSESIVYNEDCIAVMARYPDKYFDLAVCDPPYGIGEDGSKNITRGGVAKPKNYKGFIGNDKHPPNEYYFTQLKRVSKNQIIWGANHFLGWSSPCWIVWDKQNGENDFADCELAYTSFYSAVRLFRFRWAGMLQGDMKNKEIRIHPTQKPVKLYEWILKNYAKPADKIFDSHLGSGSSRIAAYKMGFDFVGAELDQDYYLAQEKRFNEFKKQLTLF